MYLMTTSTMVHVRVDERVKNEASAALAEMGLSVSDAVRVLLTRIAAERALPFELRVPNAESQEAIQELRARRQRKQGGRAPEAVIATKKPRTPTSKKAQGKQRFASVEALMADLNEVD